ncbi:MAG: sulfatase-like hydrolase/transferase [Sedimentisphaerales bacterium]|nr:sulfatase-like hydrolase/transferase [Sedimentisphaerales bacterium]
MNRRTFLKIIAGTVGLPCLGCSGVLSSSQSNRPNILFIFIDDMGYADPSCFGNPKMKTPNIDRLATKGIRLTNFYVNSPICSPSRVAVMTGQYPHRWKIYSYLAAHKANRDRNMADWLDPKAPTTARILQQAGYATAHFGKWHIGGGRDVGDAPLPQEYGFDESLVSFEGLGDRILFPNDGLCEQSRKLERGRIQEKPKHQSTETYVDRTIDFIQTNRDKPFYIELFPNDVHDAHLPKPDAIEKWKQVTDNPFEQKFFAVLEELDRQIGRLIQTVDELKIDKQTLIVLTSDNGPTDWPSYYNKGHTPPGFTGPFFGRKWSLYEGGIRMPFIARWKGTIPAGVTNETSVMCGIDLSPTFCRFANVPVPSSVKHDGLAMNEALLGKSIRRSKPIFWQYGPPYAKLKPGNSTFISPSLAVRDGDWKLLINPDGTDAHFYNLKSDPGETRNLAIEQPERTEQLWQKIRSWAISVSIPIQETQSTQEMKK